MRSKKDILADAPEGVTHYCPYIDRYYNANSGSPMHKVVCLKSLAEVEPDALADAVLQYPSYPQYCACVEWDARFDRETWQGAAEYVWVLLPIPVTATPEVDATLAERGNRYGDFAGHADITQAIKDVMRSSPTSNWARLTSSQKEALEMVAHKVGRILNGDPDYADSWHDVAGYVRLVEKQLANKQE